MVNKEANSAHVIEGALGIESAEHFLEMLSIEKTCLVKTRSPALRSIITPQEIAKILCNSRHSNPGLRLAKDGKIIDPKTYTYSYNNLMGEGAPLICHESVYDLTKKGATLVYDNIEEKNEKILTLIQAMEFLLEEYCSAHLYISEKQEPGLDIHWDDHDVLVLHIYGRKNWSLYEKDIPYPIREDRLEKPGHPGKEIWSGILEPGDMLYIPRGYWHLPEAIGEPCCHLSIAIDRKVGKQYANWLIDRLSDETQLRMNMPATDYAAQCSFTDDFIRTITRKIESNNLEVYRDAIKAHSHPRQFYDFIELDISSIESYIDNKCYIFTLVSRFPLKVESNSKEAWFYQCSKKFTYPAYAKDILTLLASAAYVDSSNITKVNNGKCTYGEIKSLLMGLIHEGVGRIHKKWGHL